MQGFGVGAPSNGVESTLHTDPKDVPMASIHQPSNPQHNSRNVDELIFSAAAIAITDRDREVPEGQEGDVFGPDQGEVDRIMDRLFDYVFNSEPLTAEELHNNAERVEGLIFSLDGRPRMNTWESRIDTQNVQALRVLKEALDLFACKARSDEADSVNKFDKETLDRWSEETLDEMVQLLMKAGLTKDEASQRIEHGDHPWRW